MPTAGSDPTKETPLGFTLIEVEGLRIELTGEVLDVRGADWSVPDRKVLKEELGRHFSVTCIAPIGMPRGCRQHLVRTARAALNPSGRLNRLFHDGWTHRGYEPQDLHFYDGSRNVSDYDISRNLSHGKFPSAVR